ncbi:MAG TPA: DUF6516 family protein [Stellaceae bacterium]|nr:DUF6516 family protein [Stellaceae bacterium]
MTTLKVGIASYEEMKARTMAVARGERLVGFDNAHPVGRQKRGAPQDHRHRLRSIRPYEYRDAATLLADFWEIVDAVLRERGVIP